MFGDTVFLVADMFALVTLLNVVSIFAEIQLPSASLSRRKFDTCSWNVDHIFKT